MSTVTAPTTQASSTAVEGAAAPAPVDPAAFARVFVAEAPRVFRLLRRLGVREADVEDLCQEVFSIVYRRWHEFRGEAALSTWVYGIALRTGLAHHRSKHVRATRASVAEHEAPAVAPEQLAAVERAEQQDVLRAALERLDEAQREVFVLYELEEVSMREIASLLGVPLHTAYGRLYTARRVLAATLKKRSSKDGLP